MERSLPDPSPSADVQIPEFVVLLVGTLQLRLAAAENQIAALTRELEARRGS